MGDDIRFSQLNVSERAIAVVPEDFQQPPGSRGDTAKDPFEEVPGCSYPAFGELSCCKGRNLLPFDRNAIDCSLHCTLRLHLHVTASEKAPCI
jgi:hypothetical protein